ncbi:MAG: hypothetical protein ACTSUE_22090 [Promethearchaeota archaeon]
MKEQELLSCIDIESDVKRISRFSGKIKGFLSDLVKGNTVVGKMLATFMSLVEVALYPSSGDPCVVACNDSDLIPLASRGTARRVTRT